MDNEIVFVTHNTGKIKAAERYFNNLKFTTFNYELDEPRSDDIKEIALDREEKWSDLWYIFKPKGFEKTLAEMDAKEREERRKIDGSVQAMQEFAKWYEKDK